MDEKTQLFSFHFFWYIKMEIAPKEKQKSSIQQRRNRKTLMPEADDGKKIKESLKHNNKETKKKQTPKWHETKMLWGI